tara:strand:+ start:244 stop:510 length:267 start_codon:yes stop_codon:yes gene_type:complete
MIDQEKVYPNSKVGVLSLLREESNINMSEDNNQINVVSDPSVEGVWKVDIDPKINDGDNVVIVELAGYVDPWGIKRIVNDWELGNFIK